ncbi:hypothetical protein FACS1894122_04370 [Alphaproteobacteria bacterium]|nr:hypothetical protein FACS1894122_04370 [Alphaproteobacteria bacterium]
MRVLLFMLCLLTACSEQEKKSNTALEGKNTVAPLEQENKSAAVLSEKSNIISNDLVVKAGVLKDLDSVMLQQKIEKSNKLFSADGGTKDDLTDDVKEVKDSTVKAPDNYQIPIRTYTPLKNSDKNFIVMYVRDRGRTKGNIEVHDPICRKIANTLGATVVYADCRQEYTKDHPLATTLNDDVASVFSWLSKSFPTMKIVISGENDENDLSSTPQM